MKEVPYTNTTERFQTIGLKTVPPGETRPVDARLIPGYKPERQAAEKPADPVAELQSGKAAEIQERIPSLSDADLDRLAGLEAESKKPRSTVLQALEAERLDRAQRRVAAELADLSDEDLAARMEAESAKDEPDPEALTALEAELERRTGKGAEE